MSTSTAAARISQIKSLIRSLPSSPLSGELQLSSALEAILDRAGLASAPTSKPTSSTSSVSTSTASTTFDELRAADKEERLVQMRDSISRIRSGQAAKDFPLAGSILSPPNDPHYYTRLRNGMHNAEKGVSRAWWKIFFNVKGEE